MPNRLADETSPYLLQHAHNPVDWYPWGPEALERAKREDKPIFLSIGYAACHWCHVMERESFEDAATAERPEPRTSSRSRSIARSGPTSTRSTWRAVQAMTGGGGWPMTVFLTPDGQPFYGGTYFPPQPHHGLPVVPPGARGRRRGVARRPARGRRRRRRGLVGGARVARAQSRRRPGPRRRASCSTRRRPSSSASSTPRNGGWGGAPKFPQPMTLEFLLRRAVATGDPRPLRDGRAATLDAMADGGIHDQLGGGFHRYATDAIWLVPHFEKMLYDNAQLARAYLHAWAARPATTRYREVAIGTLDYLLRELRRDDGTFAASQDADTDGE